MSRRTRRSGTTTRCECDAVNEVGLTGLHFAAGVQLHLREALATCDDTDLLLAAFVHEAQSAVTVVMINRDTAAKAVNCSLRNLPRQIATFSQYRTSSTENCVDVGSVTVSRRGFSATVPADSVTTFAGRLGP